ncbi:prepilin-type N-terminal cleavage/methylation domain-containing protein [Desulfobacter latus]|uniref:Prepilin-type N-terminal cleavage/methylation domain-containing protein n=1 Tax=Desulfobacter latus TaxID=2292 RepID=A0A850TBA5_9BACT|nr:prepilin-type N-terminal cleavage/methylation domain-containing protein [Desulfobacter latus]
MTDIIKIKIQGYTLIEVMMALVVFSIGMPAIIWIQISAIQGNDDAAEMRRFKS